MDNLQIYGWDEKIGLWAEDCHGHTADTKELAKVHPILKAAWILVHAGMDDSLKNLQIGRILDNIRSVQEKEGDNKGCIRWYWEDKKISDTNAAFFTGLGLIVFHYEFASILCRKDYETLKVILDDLSYWFDRELKDIETNLRYPNKCLGDLVCAWLLAEINDDVNADLIETMDRGLGYYLEKDWGWGEHMSDGYSKVCQDELVAMLMYSKELPAHLMDKVEQLYRELLSIDAVFGEGPRVPAIRSYSFEQSPRTKKRVPIEVQPYVKQIRSLTPDQNIYTHNLIRNLAFKHNIQERFSVSASACEEINIPCYDGAEAQAIVLKNMRAGAMSRYPIMNGIDQTKWGLAWQSFPVAFWHSNGDWGFLQWESEEGGKKRAHPANKRFHWNCYTLSDELQPSPLGETRSVRCNNGFLIHRKMPQISSGWPMLIDRFRMVESSVPIPEIVQEKGWHVLTIPYADPETGAKDIFHVAYYSLWEQVGYEQTKLKQAELVLKKNNFSGWDWEVRYKWNSGSPPAQLAGIWFLQIGVGPFSPPPLSMISLS